MHRQTARAFSSSTGSLRTAVKKWAATETAGSRCAAPRADSARNLRPLATVARGEVLDGRAGGVVGVSARVGTPLSRTSHTLCHTGGWTWTGFGTLAGQIDRPFPQDQIASNQSLGRLDENSISGQLNSCLFAAPGLPRPRQTRTCLTGCVCPARWMTSL